MGLNPGAVDAELVGLMAEAGFKDLDVGAESGTDATLEGLGKNFGREALFRTARLLHEKGISAHWFLILGGPNETMETALETFRTMDEVAAPWDVVGLNVGLRVYDGSPLASRLRQNDPHCTADDFLTPVTYQPEGVSLAELRRLALREVRRRPNFMIYDEIDRAPAWSARATAALFDLLGLRAPLWKAFVAARRLKETLFLGRLRRRAGG